MMRSSEEMACVLYHAWAGFIDDEMNHNTIQWDDLSEDVQTGYLAQVNALFNYLFEHGRISQYVNAQQLEEAQKEYSAYLEGEVTDGR